ncbi:MAG: hypothetical protein JW909_09515 [Planctomycetes bacterium]|nr:hypothetical protein [Planctomycetota bacterium]
MQVFYCDSCGQRFSDADVGDKGALVVGKAAFCKRCASDARKKLTSSGTLPVQNIGDGSDTASRRGARRTGQRHKVAVSHRPRSAAVILLVLAIAIAVIVVAFVLVPKDTVDPGIEMPQPQQPQPDPVQPATPLRPPIGGTTPADPERIPLTPPPRPDATAPAEELALPVEATATQANGSGPIPGSPEGAFFHVDFEPDAPILAKLKDRPRTFVEGLSGKASGPTQSDPENFRFSIRYTQWSTIAELPRTAVFVLTMQAESKPLEIFFEVTHLDQKNYVRYSPPIRLQAGEYTFVAFTLGDAIFSSRSTLKELPGKYPCGWFDIRSKDGAFYVDTFTIFADGSPDSRINDVKRWLKSPR